MRTDSLMIGSIKQNQLISIVLIVLGIAYLIFKYVKIKPDYYIYYLDLEFEPVINKQMVKSLVKRDERIAYLEQLKKEALEEEKEAPKKIEKKAEEPITYEVPEELSKEAPFRKSKYIVDDDEDGE